MRIGIQSSAAKVDERSRGYIERRIGFALGRFSDRIRSIRVRIDDENGPKGGPDLICRLTIRGDEIGEIHLEDRDMDLRALVDRTLQRAGRSVARVVDRGRIFSPIPVREAFPTPDEIMGG